MAIAAQAEQVRVTQWLTRLTPISRLPRPRRGKVYLSSTKSLFHPSALMYLYAQTLARQNNPFLGFYAMPFELLRLPLQLNLNLARPSPTKTLN